MGLFLSKFINKIDKKGRVSVPASYRAILSQNKTSDFQGIIVYESFLHVCIEACGLDRIEELHNSIDNLDPFSSERDAFATTILGNSQQLSFDNEGRVIIPKDLLEKSGINEFAAFVGKGSTFEIWNPETLEKYMQDARMYAKENRNLLKKIPNEPKMRSL
jgi:MraZ protein